MFKYSELRLVINAIHCCCYSIQFELQIRLNNESIHAYIIISCLISIFILDIGTALVCPL